MAAAAEWSGRANLMDGKLGQSQNWVKGGEDGQREKVKCLWNFVFIEGGGKGLRCGGG